MPLESTMVCLDNSDWMRNGDYAPSRLESQQDAASLICNDRINSNPENTVGILAMAGGGVDLLVSPTEEAGKILASFASISIGGKTNLSTAVQIAQLALKHRKNKNGGQRIIAFVGSPLVETTEQLIKIGKNLKKNNVAVDVISIGEMEENSEKLLEFVNTTNSNENSHLIVVPPGVSPANAVMSSPVMHMGAMAAGMGMGAGPAGSAGGGGGGGGGGGDFDMYGGIDPEMDPELAMAIRVSTEEARAQEEARLKAQQEAGGGGGEEDATAGAAASTGSNNEKGSTNAAGFGGAGAVDEEDEDALMQRALEMSMQEMSTAEGSGNDTAAAASTELGTSAASAGAFIDGEEDPELALAMQLSMGAGAGTSSSSSAAGTGVAPPVPPTTADIADPSFVSQLLGTADQSDPQVQAAMAQLQTNNNNTPPPPPPPSSEDKKDGDETGKKRKGDDA